MFGSQFGQLATENLFLPNLSLNPLRQVGGGGGGDSVFMVNGFNFRGSNSLILISPPISLGVEA